jgi:hypothetical protein
MTEYGFILDQDLQFEKRNIYELFTNYFGNPLLTKIKDQSGVSVYAGRAAEMLRDRRYLIVLIDSDKNPLGKRYKLDELPWKCLQTRTNQEEYNCDSFSYMPNTKAPYDTRMLLKERKPTLTSYMNKKYKFSLCLLHTDDTTRYEYGDIGTLHSALETYQTIIQIEI